MEKLSLRHTTVHVKLTRALKGIPVAGAMQKYLSSSANS